MHFLGFGTDLDDLRVDEEPSINYRHNEATKIGQKMEVWLHVNGLIEVEVYFSQVVDISLSSCYWRDSYRHGTHISVPYEQAIHRCKANYDEDCDNPDDSEVRSSFLVNIS